MHPESVQYVIDTLTDEPGSVEDLTAAIENNDEALFKSTMRNGHCRISDDANKLLHFFNSFDLGEKMAAAENVWKADRGNVGEFVYQMIAELPNNTEEDVQSANVCKSHIEAIRDEDWAYA